MEFLTHVFGEGTSGTTTIPPNKKQYSSNPNKPNALQLNIYPVYKKLNTSDGTMNTLNAPIEDIHFFDNSKNAPTFDTLKFKLPDPTQSIDIDTDIPKILIEYHKSGWLDLAQLNDYLNKYMFSNVIRAGKNYGPRISLATGGGLLPKNIAEMWKGIQGNTFSISANGYCTQNNLTGGYCNTYCRTTTDNTINCDKNLTDFCKTPGKGKLPKLAKDGKLPMSSSDKITQKLLDAAYPNYTKYPEVCGCNMPQEYYGYLNIMNFQNIEGGDKIYETLFRQGAIDDSPNCNPFSNCKGAASLPNKQVDKHKCPDVNVQNCIQNNTVIANNSLNTTATNQQTMNCLQQITKVEINKAEEAAKAKTKAEADKAAAAKAKADAEEAAVIAKAKDDANKAATDFADKAKKESKPEETVEDQQVDTGKPEETVEDQQVDTGKQTGPAIGGIIGILLFLILLSIVVYFILKKKKA